jgi:GNAT superfamily N-acetyltransferase
MKISLAQSQSDIEAAAVVMQQLRPQFTLSQLIEQIQRQQHSGYQVAMVETEHQVIAVAGFVIGEKLAWGKHLYVDDLVTDERFRSAGAGGQLIKWLEQYAKDQGCQQLHLDSGVQRFGAHKFYLLNDFDITSHHFAKNL